MIGRHASQNVHVVGRVMAPCIAMFGLYVIAHGHYGPGGGFAGGVVLAVALVLLRLVAERERTYRRFPPVVGLIAMCIGMLLFIATGLASMIVGGNFLDYGELAADVGSEPRARYLGILVVEVAVGLTVFGGIALTFDTLTGGPRR